MDEWNGRERRVDNPYLTTGDFYRYMDKFKDGLNERLGEMRDDITRLQSNVKPANGKPAKNNGVVHIMAEIIRLLVVALLAAVGVKYIGN